MEWGVSISQSWDENVQSRKMITLISRVLNSHLRLLHANNTSNDDNLIVLVGPK